MPENHPFGGYASSDFHLFFVSTGIRGISSDDRERKIIMQNLKLPPGFYVEWDSDVLTLHGEDDSPVAVFSILGVCPEEIEKTAEAEHRWERGQKESAGRASPG